MKTGIIKMVWFWIVSFSIIIYNTFKMNEWHMVYVDFHLGDDLKGRPVRKQLIAMRTTDGANIRWQNLRSYNES